jgi:hypothetical protein
MRHVVVTLFVLIATFFIAKATFQHFIALINRGGGVCALYSVPLFAARGLCHVRKANNVLVIKYDRAI